MIINSNNAQKVHGHLNPTKQDPAFPNDPTKRIPGDIKGPVRVTVLSGGGDVIVDADGRGFFCISGPLKNDSTLYNVEADAIEDGSLIQDSVQYDVTTVPPPVNATNDLGLTFDAPEAK
jgi:hypothetical protein